MNAFQRKLHLLICTALTLILWHLLDPAFSSAEVVDVSGQVSISTANEHSTLDRMTREVTSVADITILNTSAEPLALPIHAVFDLSSTQVDMQGALGGIGSPPYNTYYFDLNSLVTGNLNPGEAVTFQAVFIRFYTVFFTYNVRIFAEQTIVIDQCPDDSEKTEPGVCGCGIPDIDTDNDGTFDCNDQCPNDPNKIEPGSCGCGVADSDSNGNGILDCLEGNQPPALEIVEDKIVAEGSTLEVAITAVDPENDLITLTAPFLPPFCQFSDTGNGAGVLACSPGYMDSASSPYMVTITATDEPGAFSTVSFSVAVTNVNRPPILEPVSNQQTVEGQELTFALTGSDPDNDPLVFSAGNMVPGASLTEAGAFSWIPDFDQSGIHHIFFVLSDGEFSVEQQGRITVTDYNLTPVITTQEIPSAEINKLYKKSIEAADPDGDSLTFALTGGPPDLSIDPWSGQLVWRPALADMGEYSIQIQVSDNRGGTDSRQYALVVPDTIPPSVFLNAPALAIPGSSFTVSALAADNDLVSSVTLHGAGFGSEQFLLPPYERLIQLPELAQVGTSILFTAIAVDPSGNTAEATVLVNIVGSPDITPPQVTLHGPTQAGQGQTILLTATAQDDVGVATVAFSIGDGTIIGSSPGSNARVLFTIAADAPLDSVLQFQAVAEDFSGHSAAAQATTLVVGEPNLTPPEPTGETPDEVEEDEPLIVVVHTDNDTCLVEIYINHILAAVFTGPQNGSLSVPLPPGVEGNMEVPVEVVVTDCAANTTRQEDVVTILATGQGLITGEVYNDRTGLPLALAQLRFTSAGDEVVIAQTDQAGRFSLVADSGAGALVISAAGFTTVVRSGLVVPENAGVEVFDARLTPISASQPTASAVLGSVLRIPFSSVTAGFMPVFADKGQDPDSVAAADIVLDIPGGSCTVDHDFTMTQISGQGLAGFLPGGWSPLGAVDIGPAAVSFLQSATLTIPNSLGISDPQGLVLSSWDEGSSAWRLVAAITLSQDGSLIAGEIPSSGQYAFLLADLVPERPATVQPGELLAGVIPALVPEVADTSISPQPQIIFYHPGVYSDVGLNVSTGSPDLSSGTPLLTVISEEYDFYDSSRMTPAPYEQDIIGYSWNRTALTASWPVTPFMEFETLALRRGTIIVDALAPVDADRQISVAGPEGGTVSAADGAVLRLPAGAVAALVPLGLNSLTAGDVAVEIPLEFDFIGGISLITADAVFGLPAQLTIPLPGGFTDEGRIVLVNLQEVQGATRFVLVGLGQVQGGTISSLYELPGGNNRKLPGITREGRYLFLQILSPTGFAAGRIYDTSAAPLSGALITEESLSLISLSGTDGVYGALVPVGQFALTGQDTQTMDEGLVPGTILAAGDLVLLDITLQQQPPSVVSVDPQDEAENVTLASAINVRFSEPLDPATVIFDNVTLTGPQGQLAGTINLSSADTVLTFRPTESLLPDTLYTFSVSQEIRDLAGHALDAVFTMGFSSLDTLPPPMPPAGSIAATIPADTGQTTITATQGTAGPHDIVTIINKTKNTSIPVLVESDGSFSVNIDADIIDEVVISITDPAGNEITVPIEHFMNPDGSTVIGPDGGLLEADNGVILDIPAGAFPEGAIVRLTGLAEAEIGIPTGPDFPFVAGFEIESSVWPAKYLNASAPLPAGINTDTRGIVALVSEAFGEPVLSIVDTARVIDGRLATSSPPCPGIVARAGRYSMYMNEHQTMAMAQALLSIVAPAEGNWVMDVLVEREMELYSAFWPLYDDTLRGIYHAAAVPVSREYAGLAYKEMYQSMCMPVPAGQTLKVTIRNLDTGELMDVVDVDPVLNGHYATINYNFNRNDTAAPAVLDVKPIHKVLDIYNKTIRIKFSEPISPESVATVTLIATDENQTVFEGDWELQENNSLLVFKTRRPLPMGKNYRLNLTEVEDLAGNKYHGEEILFSTFNPYLIFPTSINRLDRNAIANDLSVNIETIPSNLWFTDVDFVTKSPEESLDGKWHTDLAAIQAGEESGYRLFYIDLSDPTAPIVKSAFETDNRFPQKRIRLLDDVLITPRPEASGDPQFWKERELHFRVDDPTIRICAAPDSLELAAWQEFYCQVNPDNPDALGCDVVIGGCGDLAVTCVDNNEYSYLWSYDVTDFADPMPDNRIKWVSSRMLSDNGVSYGNSRYYEAPAGLGTTMGLATLQYMDIDHGGMLNENTVGAYVANYGIGLELVDLGLNLPTINAADRRTESLDPWAINESLKMNVQLFYRDVAVVRDKIVAIAADIRSATTIQTLEIFSPDLSGEPTGMSRLTNMPKRLVTVIDLPVWEDQTAEYELYDLAFVTGENGGIAVVEIPEDGSNPQRQGFIQTPPGVVTKDIQIDRETRVAYVSALKVDPNALTDYLLVVDLSNPFAMLLWDEDNDGWDDRIIGKIPIVFQASPFPVYLHGFRLDPERGLIYAGVVVDSNEANDKHGLVVIKVRECPDLGIDFIAKPELPYPIDIEKQALQRVIQAGLTEGASECEVDIDSITMIEQGSGSCIWKGNDACGPNYQPGISDHDFEVFFPETVSEENRQCVVNALYDQVFTPMADPIPIEVQGYDVTFDDVSFYHMTRENFEEAELDIYPPTGDQGDVTGDMGLGRQMLLLKWLIEGYYVDVPGMDLKGKDFKDIFNILKTPWDIDNDGEDDEPTHIPRLEGYEWAKLQEAMMYDSGALIRVHGASETGTTLNRIFTKDLHKTAKAAIRTVLARIIADNTGNELSANFEYESTLCIEVENSYTPYIWRNVPCDDSFSLYIASLAARIARDYPEESLFTPEDIVDKIYRFYRVKSGKEEIETEQEANEFISMALQFIQEVGNDSGEARDIYYQTIVNDPRQVQRESNISSALQKIQEEQIAGEKHIVPRIFNKGSKEIDATIWARMFTGNQETGKENISPEPGDYVHVDTRKDPSLNPDNPDGLTEPRKNVDVFQIEANQTNPQQKGWVSFFVDIPDKNTIEADRQNNWGKLYYYVLDPANPVVPTLPVGPVLEEYFNLPVDELLEPDPECECVRPDIQFTQSINGINDPNEIIPVYTNADGQACFTVDVRAENLSNTDYYNIKIISFYQETWVEQDTIDKLPAGGVYTTTFEYCLPAGVEELQGQVGIYYMTDAQATTYTISGSNLLNIAAFCPITIMPTDPNPNPDISEIMYGGAVYRYYQVIDQSVGGPIEQSGIVVKATIDQGSIPLIEKIYSTDEFGNIGQINAEGVFEEGVKILWEDISGAILDGTFPVRVKLEVVDYCTEPMEFDILAKKLEYYETLDACTSLSIEVGFKGFDGIFKGGSNLHLGLKGKKDGTDFLNQSSEQFVFRGSSGGDVGAGIGASAGKFKLRSPWVNVNVGAAAGVKFLIGYSSGSQYEFNIDDPTAALTSISTAALLLQTLAENGELDPVNRFMLNNIHKISALADFVVGSKASSFWDTTVQFEGSAGAEAKVNGGTKQMPGQLRDISTNFALINAGLGSGVKINAQFGSETFIAGGDKSSLHLSGELQAEAGLQSSLDKMAPGDITDIMDGVVKKLMSFGQLSGGIKFDITVDKNNSWIPAKLDMTFYGQKDYGFQQNIVSAETLQNLGEGTQNNITYTIQGVDGIIEAIKNASEFKGILEDSIKDLLQDRIALNPDININEMIEIGPSLAFESLLNTLYHVLSVDGVEYTIEKKNGNGKEIPFEIGAKFLGTGLTIGLNFKGDYAVSYLEEKGTLQNSKNYVLEKYSGPGFSAPSAGELENWLNKAKSEVSKWLMDNNVFTEIERTVGPTGMLIIKSVFSSELQLINQADFESILGPLSFQFEAISGPVNPYYYAPMDIIGSADKPHYGVGGFHSYYPHELNLTEPATLILDYYENEIAGVDENTIAVYKWNEAIRNWDLLPGDLNTADNTVTTEITQLGTYTLAPAMPSGNVIWASQQTQLVGENTIVTLTSEVLTMNNGNPVLDGTVVHVASVVPYAFDQNGAIPFGTILTTDVQLDVAGTQVLVDNGVIQLEIEYPAGLSPDARIIVFSDIGTAFGDELISLVMP